MRQEFIFFSLPSGLLTGLTGFSYFNKMMSISFLKTSLTGLIDFDLLTRIRKAFIS